MCFRALLVLQDHLVNQGNGAHLVFEEKMELRGVRGRVGLQVYRVVLEKKQSLEKMDLRYNRERKQVLFRKYFPILTCPCLSMSGS